MPTRLRNNCLWPALLAALFAILLLGSCTTMGETKLASSVNEQGENQVLALENRLPGLINRPDTGLRIQIEHDTNSLLATASYNKIFQARLWGILAETAWLYQDRPLLDKAIRQMELLDKSQPRLIIAKSRLTKASERIAILQTAIDADPDNPQALIKLEQALVYFDEQRFREAAAAFDDAFATLEQVWVSLYNDKRNIAYRQKDSPLAQSKREGSWMAQEKVNLESLVGLALLRTRYLDQYGKESVKTLDDLVKKLEKDQYLPKSDTEPSVDSKLSTQQTRGAAAWFLFRIAITQENRPDLLNGGKEWKTSPILDLSLDDPAFRAILGVVQREILNLPDGSNFHPMESLPTSEYLKALERLHTLYP